MLDFLISNGVILFFREKQTNMGSDGNWWDPYCPCRVTRKNVVMTFLGLCCLALVTWTVVSSGNTTPNPPLNVSIVFVDDSKSIDNLNFTLSSVLIRDAADKAQEKKMVAIKTGLMSLDSHLNKKIKKV